MFKRSLQVTVLSVFPHVTMAPEFFFNQICFLVSRPASLGLILKNRVQSVFFEVINSTATSMCSMI